MKRNSERSSPTPSPPRPAICVASSSPPMFATTSMRVPSERDGRFVRVGEVLLAALLGALLRAGGCARLPPARRCRRSVPFVAVENRRAVPFGIVERRGLDAGERGNAQRTREDRHVRSGAAARRAKAHHARAIERCGIGWREILRDEHACSADTRASRRLLPVRSDSTRMPTSRRSFARWASSWLRRPASRSAWVATAFFHANAALFPWRSRTRRSRADPDPDQLLVRGENRGLRRIRLGWSCARSAASCPARWPGHRRAVCAPGPACRPLPSLEYPHDGPGKLLLPPRPEDAATPTTRFRSTSFWGAGAEIGAAFMAASAVARGLISKSFSDHRRESV